MKAGVSEFYKDGSDWGNRNADGISLGGVHNQSTLMGDALPE